MVDICLANRVIVNLAEVYGVRVAMGGGVNQKRSDNIVARFILPGPSKFLNEHFAAPRSPIEVAAMRLGWKFDFSRIYPCKEK